MVSSRISLRFCEDLVSAQSIKFLFLLKVDDMGNMVKFWLEETSELDVCYGWTCFSRAQRREQIQRHAKRRRVRPQNADITDAQLAHHLLWGAKPPGSKRAS